MYILSGARHGTLHGTRVGVFDAVHTVNVDVDVLLPTARTPRLPVHRVGRLVVATGPTIRRRAPLATVLIGCWALTRKALLGDVTLGVGLCRRRR